VAAGLSWATTAENVHGNRDRGEEPQGVNAPGPTGAHTSDNSLLRNRVEEEPAELLDMAEANFESFKVGWVFGDSNETCNEACEDAGGVCNLGPMREVDTSDKIRYIVEEILGEPAFPYRDGDTNYNPGYEVRKAGCEDPTVDEACDPAYYYNGDDGVGDELNACDANFFLAKRICCCSKDSMKCPTLSTS
jgi:hypothetical protein